MKTAQFVSAIVLALLIAIPATAQEKQEKKKGPAVKLTAASMGMLRLMRFHDAVETLELTDEEGKKLASVLGKISPKMKDVMEKLGDVVTEEQMAAAREAGAKAKEAKKEGRQLFVAVEAAVKLTDDQKKKMDVIGKEMMAVYRTAVKDVTAVLPKEQQEKFKKALMPRTKKEGNQNAKKKKAE